MLMSAMLYREELSSCSALDAVWTLTTRHDLGGSLPYLTLPDGCVDIIYRLKRDMAGKADSATLLVAGPTDSPATFFPSAGEEFVGVRFAPGWGGLTLGVSPAELFRAFTGARSLTVRLARLEESLFACKSQQQAALTLQSTVEAWTGDVTLKRPVLDAVRMLRLCGGRIRVEQAARYLGVSSRSLRRDLKDLVGLSPKSLVRIFRFRRALETLHQCKSLSLRDLALEAGYADQAHMTRDFRTLGGFTPKSPVVLPGTAVAGGN